MFASILKKTIQFVVVAGMGTALSGSFTHLSASDFLTENQKILENALRMDPIAEGDFQRAIFGKPSKSHVINLRNSRGPASGKKAAKKRRRRKAKRHRRSQRHHHWVRHVRQIQSKPKGKQSSPVHSSIQRSTGLRCVDRREQFPVLIEKQIQEIEGLKRAVQKNETTSSCDFKQQIDLEQLHKEVFSLYRSSDVQSRQIHGVLLEGTQEELDAAQAILSENPPSKWASVNCSAVRCALAQVFGSEEAALRAMVIRKKYGYTPSLSQKYSQAGAENLWSAIQLKAISAFLEKVPAPLLSRARLKELMLFSPDLAEKVGRENRLHIRPGGVYTSFDLNKPAILINTAAHDTFEGMTSVFSHEFAHAVDLAEVPHLSLSSGFDQISHWKDFEGPDGRYLKNTYSEFVEDYSASSPIEDFADAFSYYVTSPDILKDIDPVKYRLMRDRIFGGREYFSSNLLDSPEFEKVIDQQGGYPALLRACISQLEMRLGSQGELWVNSDSEDGLSLRGDVFIQKGSNPCLTNFAQRMSEAMLNQGQEVCILGGEDAIKAHLKSLLNYPLEKILRSASRQLKSMRMEDRGASVCEQGTHIRFPSEESPATEVELAEVIVAQVGRQCR